MQGLVSLPFTRLALALELEVFEQETVKNTPHNSAQIAITLSGDWK